MVETPSAEKAAGSEIDEARDAARSFKDAVIETAVKYQEAVEAGKDCRKTIVALGTRWMPGYGKGERSLQHAEMNKLVVSMRRFCEDKGIPFIAGDEAAIEAAVAGARSKEGYGNARVVVLAGKDTLDTDLAHLKEDENAFIAGVDNKNLGEDSYIRVIEMLNLAMKLAADPDMQPHSTYIEFTKQGKFWIFTPRDEPKKYEELMEAYKVQASA